MVKRGAALFRIDGGQADEAVERLLAAAGEGAATVDELALLFGSEHEEAVRWLIEELRRRNVLLPAQDVDPGRRADPTDTFYWQFTTADYPSAEPAADRRITVVGRNQTSTQLLRRLNEAHLDNIVLLSHPALDGPHQEQAFDAPTASGPTWDDWIADGQPDTDVLVCVTDHAGLGSVRPWNELCLRTATPFLPVVLHDMVAFVGPLVIPGATACYECFLARRYSNLDDHQLRRQADDVPDDEGTFTAFHPAMASFTADLAAIELTKFLMPWRELWHVGEVITGNLLATEVRRHRLLKVPRCSACSSLNVRQPTGMYMQPTNASDLV